MVDLVEMTVSRPMGRLVAATDMAATAANPQMQPIRADLEAFLATLGAGRHGGDGGDMATGFGHASILSGRMSQS